MALRIRQYDRDVVEFLSREPDGIVVNLGCGLNDRRRRCDNGRARWFDLDLPEVIALRRRFLAETDRMRFIAASVLDSTWLDELPSGPGHKFLFVAEGLFMYLQPEVFARWSQRSASGFPAPRCSPRSPAARPSACSTAGSAAASSSASSDSPRTWSTPSAWTRPGTWRAGRRESSCSASGPTSTRTSPRWVVPPVRQVADAALDSVHRALPAGDSGRAAIGHLTPGELVGRV